MGVELSRAGHQTRFLEFGNNNHKIHIKIACPKTDHYHRSIRGGHVSFAIKYENNSLYWAEERDMLISRCG